MPHEVRDRDYFFLWSFSAWGVWAALGLVYVWESIAALVGRETRDVGRETVELPTRRELAARVAGARCSRSSRCSRNWTTGVARRADATRATSRATC